MKTSKFKYMAMACLAALVVSGCSPDEYAGVDENGLPTVDGVDFNINVDQTTNEVVFSMDKIPADTYPVWFIDTNQDGKTDFYSTLSELSKVYSSRGTYSVALHLANRNGFSRAAVEKTFTVENDLLDPAVIARLSGKEWRIDHATEAHLACGAPDGDGTNWWSAKPEEKAGLGLYDDRISFTADGAYTYNPGEGGTVYVNTGSGLFKEFDTNDNTDYMAKVEPQTSTYKIEMAGDQKYLVLGNKSLFPYLSTGDQYESPRFRIEDITSKKLVLVYANKDIAWHFVFTSTDDVPVAPSFGGYKYDSNCNMWKTAHFTNDFFYAHGDAWEANPNPIGFSDGGNGVYTVTLPDASSQQWQAQVKFFTDMASNASTKYDFSIKLEASQDIKGATVKLTKHGDDGTYYFEGHVDLNAGENTLFYKDNMDGLDMENVDLVLDFGGAPAGTTVKVSDVVFKEHDCDDGAGHPQDGPAPDNSPYAYDAADNLWKAVDATDCEMFYFYANADWAAYPEHQGFKHEGKSYTLTFPNATAAQWQNQVAFYTPLSCAAEETYDFCCVMNPSVDMTNVTVKLVRHGEGNAGDFFFDSKVNLTGGEDNVIKLPAQKAPTAMESIDLFFDFGGNPANSQVVIKDIVLKKSAH